MDGLTTCVLEYPPQNSLQSEGLRDTAERGPEACVEDSCEMTGELVAVLREDKKMTSMQADELIYHPQPEYLSLNVSTPTLQYLLNQKLANDLFYDLRNNCSLGEDVVTMTSGTDGRWQELMLSVYPKESECIELSTIEVEPEEEEEIQIDKSSIRYTSAELPSHINALQLIKDSRGKDEKHCGMWYRIRKLFGRSASYDINPPPKPKRQEVLV